jgi:hypothetical protein
MMKTPLLRTSMTIMAVILALVTGTGAATAAPGLGTSAGHDLDALWAAAQQSPGFKLQDAVLLLESRDVAINDAGQVTTTVHRVVWIGTAAGLRAHADLRVPWNSATCTFEVAKLRTWREGRWWPDAERISETAVVHTLPYAVDHADDYTAMRETMLLHDGVELPCIMETLYTITERNLPAVDDVFVLAQRDPAMLVQLSVSAPSSRKLHHFELNGAPAPVAGERDGNQVLTWSLRPAPALRLPLTGKPAAFEPTVAWSTFGDERKLGDAWNSAFWEAAVAPKAVVDSLRATGREAAGDRARVEAGGRWLAAAVRLIHTDERWWAFAPRPATRTWETGYGHVLDRAVLWASLLKADGWQVLPVLADAVGAPAAAGLPHLAGRGRLLLHIQGGADAPSRRPILVCDPEDFTVTGESVLDGRPLLWLYGEAKPQPPRGEGGEFTAELSLAAGDSAWTGSGWISGRGLLAFTDRVGGAPGDLAKHAKAVASSVLAGATTPAAGLTMLVRSGSDLRCDVSLPLGKADDRGNHKLVVGRPAGGLLDRLPRDARLGEESRATPVLLGGPLRQTVVLRLHLPADVAVTKPADRALANAAGRFSLVVTEADGWLEYRRELQLEASAGAATLWPALRALLLEEADAANGTLTWRPAAKK